jgi:hypothetical protein
MQAENDPEVKKQLRIAQRTRLNLRDCSIGIIKFIGQLFNVEFLKPRAIELCMNHLLGYCEHPTELDVECFCILLATVGGNLESTARGTAIVDKFLGILENIVDHHAESLVHKIRCLILDVFELRDNNWQPIRPDQFSVQSPPRSQLDEVAVKVEAARKNREFLKTVDGSLAKAGKDKILEFMWEFLNSNLNQERLEGSVKIIFEHALASPHTGIFATICRGLENVRPEEIGCGDQHQSSFRAVLMHIIRSEIELIRQKTGDFRSLLTRLQVLKVERIKEKVDKMKSDIEMDFKLSSRAVAVADFIGELYNANFIQSCFIFDEVFTVLVDQNFVSDVTVECFSRLLEVCATKMMMEKNRGVLIKQSLVRLLKAVESIELFPKTKFVVKKCVGLCRFELKLGIQDPMEEELEAIGRFNVQSQSRLLNKSVESPVAIRGKNRDTKICVGKEPEEMSADPPKNHFERVPLPQPQSQAYAIHASVHDYIQQAQVPKRLFMNSSVNVMPMMPVPIDFSKNYINSTMIPHF